MKEKPISFKPEMVKAILENRKTQTRRLNGFDVINKEPDRYRYLGMTEVLGVPHAAFRDEQDNLQVLIKYPCGRPGHLLWVREPVAYGENDIVAYKADGLCGAWMDDGAGRRLWIAHGWIQGFAKKSGRYFSKYGWKWHSSIRMPRWACRLVLEIVSVRVERLQEISEEDARAEGIQEYGVGAVHDFMILWSSIHGPDAWIANPYVWVIEFKMVM